MTVKQLRLEPKDDKVHVCALTKPVVVSPELSATFRLVPMGGTVGTSPKASGSSG